MDTGDRPAIQGKAALLQEYQRMLGPDEFHPFVHNHIIDLEGDGARGTCYLDVRASVNGRSMIGSGFYQDRYAKVAGKWRFRSRRLTMCYFVPLSEGWAEQQQER